ncbi:MAG TPA: hypothetical protein VF290_02845 [Pyrinomonadaceae bacterium]
MTNLTNAPTIVQKYVLVFDFCSSTSILEDLIRSENQQYWQELLMEVKNFLTKEEERGKFTIYKFIGDGWILLFDANFPPRDLFLFMRSLCERYNELFNAMVRPNLASHIHTLGITFGLDRGSLSRFDMDGQVEYIGRFINVAARLQGAIKSEDDNPGGKVLMPKHLYASVKQDISQEFETRRVVVRLSNVAGAEKYRGVLLTVTDVSNARPEPELRWEDPPNVLDKTTMLVRTPALVDSTFVIEFHIDDDYGHDRNWFGVRLRGRGAASDIFDGCLVYLRSNGNLDVRTINQQRIVEAEIPQAIRKSDFVKMRISLIDDNISVWINEDLVIPPTSVPVIRSGNVYLHAWGCKVTITSAHLFEEMI